MMHGSDSFVFRIRSICMQRWLDFRRGLTLTAAFFCLTLAVAGPGLPSLAAETISLTVDATKTPQKLLKAHLVMPVKPGPLTVYYPKWIPGEHGPDGPVASLTGLKFTADGKIVPWKRDLLDVFTFHVDVP